MLLSVVAVMVRLLPSLCLCLGVVLGQGPSNASGAADKIIYTVYNRATPNGAVLSANENNDVNQVLDPNLPLVIVTHGWLRGADSPSVQLIKDGYLTYQNVNTITVDWSPLSKQEYLAALSAVKPVGTAVGELLVDLCDQRIFCSLKTTHLIGHSLGAHVMGVAGHYVRTALGLNVSRISGLDPAGPLLEYPLSPLDGRLDPSDADFVFVIHSSPVFGYRGDLGDADLRPNGGLEQSGCPSNFTDIFCSHKRAFQYFAVAIGAPKAFPAYKCSSYPALQAGRCDKECELCTVYMGPYTDPRARGDYYLTTTSTSPYYE